MPFRIHPSTRHVSLLRHVSSPPGFHGLGVNVTSRSRWARVGAVRAFPSRIGFVGLFPIHIVCVKAEPAHDLEAGSRLDV